MTAPARIGIDCRLGGLQHAGIGRYISELVQRVVNNTEYTWVLFCHDQEQATELLGPHLAEHVEVVIAPIRHYSLAEQVRLPGIFAKARLDLLHVPHFNVPLFYTGKYVVTVHDLLWHSHTGAHVTTLNQYVYWLKYLGYRLVTRFALTRAQHIFVPSQTVADIVTQTYPKTAQKVSITREGIATSLQRQVKRCQSVKRDARKLLYVGSLYPHKNVELIIQALQQLPDYQLTIVSARSVFRKKVENAVKSLGLEQRVQYIDGASDAELAQQYASAAALIQPSLSEGFGLTGLEALAFDTPVIASDIPIFHEIYADAALYIDPHSTDSLVGTVKTLTDSKVCTRLHTASTSVSRHYDWNSTAEQTLTVYEHTLATSA